MPYTVHHKISELIIKHLRGEITGEERTELNAWIDASPENKALYEELTTEETLAKQVKDINGIKSRILQTIYRELPGLKPVIPIYRRPIFKWIAAAVLIFGILTTAIVISKRSEKSPPQVAVTHDVQAPLNTRAVITLADGSKVYLDSANNGTIAQENNVNVIKKDGAISYQPLAVSKGEVVTYNTLFNPRGSKVISLSLSDGTKVWLNSESSLRYPASFASSALNREVEITGEAYFEVKHNSKQPFKVHLPNGSIVEDIGTAFNVNAYAGEADIKTTLIEGSVRVVASPNHPITQSLILKPGQQSVINRSSPEHQITTSPDIEEVLAWKNGTFSYTNSDLETIMRQMARWYDVEVVYKDKITDRYTVDVPRTVPVSQLFKFIEMSGGVHFEINGKQIVVKK